MLLQFLRTIKSFTTKLTRIVFGFIVLFFVCFELTWVCKSSITDVARIGTSLHVDRHMSLCMTSLHTTLSFSLYHYNSSKVFFFFYPLNYQSLLNAFWFTHTKIKIDHPSMTVFHMLNRNSLKQCYQQTLY